MIESIRQCVKVGCVRLTLHARMEMDRDGILTDNLLEAVAARNSEIIEDYASDPRGHSHLVLAWLSNGEPIHICCAKHEGKLIIITVYRPDTRQWNSDWRIRK